MLQWQISFVFSRGLRQKFPSPPSLAATPCASLWESGSFTCPGLSFNWLRVPCGHWALNQSNAHMYQGVSLSHTLLHLWHELLVAQPHLALSTCSFNTSSPIIHSHSKYGNSQPLICAMEMTSVLPGADFRACFVSVFSDHMLHPVLWAQLKFHGAFLVWLHYSQCRVSSLLNRK